jgi:hemerythrin-like metal-binding protein
MPYFILWQESYSVKQKTLDDQHVQIVDLINELYASKSDGSQVAPRRIMEQLRSYTETHFAHEEDMMRAAGYPDAESHARYHAWMTLKTRELSDAVIGSPDILTDEVFAFLKKWWLDHIRGIDTRYAPYMVRLDGR